MNSVIPAQLIPLLEAPNYAHLGTIRPDDTVQVNPMWFLFDGETIRYTHTTKRGTLVEVIPDPQGDFYVVLGKRYGNAEQTPPPDIADRVVLVMSIEATTGR